jgi:hypothetical protein
MWKLSSGRLVGGEQEALTAREVRVTSVIAKPFERSTVALGSLAAFDQATVSVWSRCARLSRPVMP